MPGGSRVVARELARGLARRGHLVTFLVGRHSPETPEDERREGIRIVRYMGAGRAAAFVRNGQAAMARLWREGPFDVVHTHFAYAAVGPLRAVPGGTPHLRSFYGPWNEEGWIEDCKSGGFQVKARLKRRVRRWVEASNLRRSGHIMVLSEHSRRETAAFGLSPNRVTAIPGGVDTERFAPAKDRRGVRRMLGLPEERRILLSVRRLAPRMGLENLIRAMPQVAARYPDVLLLIGGTGPDRERLEKMVAATGTGKQVRMIGFIPDERLAAYYQASDLFVLPTLALEGFGLVTVEALACGTPVVGTPVGATPEILGELEPRLVTEAATPEALAEGIRAFFDGEWGRALTPERLRGFARERYTWDRHTEATLALYESVIAEARERREIFR